jgi:hypothetical protein
MTIWFESSVLNGISRGGSSMGAAKMAVFVVIGSALTVGALMIASYLSTAAG